MKITLLDVKKALKDGRFRDLLPREKYEKDIIQFLQNPSCNCNMDLYKKILKDNLEDLKSFYSVNGEDITEEEEKIEDWVVINCHINELEDNLRSLKYGDKQISIARWEDYVTVVIKNV